MTNSLEKALVVTVMLITFIGQSLAFTTKSCELSSESHESHMSMSHDSMDHSRMDHSDMGHVAMVHSSADQSGQQKHEECCGSECQCPASACTSISIVNSEPESGYLASLNEDIASQSTDQTKSISSYLYRPPIFA